MAINQLRKHQQWIEAYAPTLTDTTGKTTTLLATPGAGKSLCVALMAQALKAPVIWVAPRLALQSQGVDVIREAIGEDIGYSADNSTGFGFATNYHALLADPIKHMKAAARLEKGPVLVVADEFHHLSGIHVPEDGTELTESEEQALSVGWGGAFDRFINTLKRKRRLKHLLIMSGTPYRTDRMRCSAVVPYSSAGHDERNKPLSRVAPTAHAGVEFDYSREHALEEGAVIPLKVHYVDGYVNYKDELRGKSYSGVLSECDHTTPDLWAATLNSYLENEDCTSHLLWSALTHYSRKQTKGRTQMLVVAASIREAAKHLRVLKSMIDRAETGFTVGIAVSKGHLAKKPGDMPEWRRVYEETGYIPDHWGIDKDGKEMQRLDAEYQDQMKSFRVYEDLEKAVKEGNVPEDETALGLFRNRRLDILVTVGKAYEGLDAPGCSHLVHLGRIRSIPWMTQCLARAWRMDYALGDPDQQAHVFVPADYRMTLTVKTIAGSVSVADGGLLMGIKRNPNKEDMLRQLELVAGFGKVSEQRVRDGSSHKECFGSPTEDGYAWEEGRDIDPVPHQYPFMAEMFTDEISEEET